MVIVVGNEHCDKSSNPGRLVGWLAVWVYGISTTMGYLMPNPVHTYITYFFFFKTNFF